MMGDRGMGGKGGVGVPRYVLFYEERSAKEPRVFGCFFDDPAEVDTCEDARAYSRRGKSAATKHTPT